MKLEHYEIETENSFTGFKFISVGRNGIIEKMIQFQKTKQKDFYNLAFGDIIAPSNEMDDLNISINGDTEKVLATVVRAVYIFFNHYSNALVYASGSTPSRTRLYQMGISKYLQEWTSHFNIVGET